jgi:hypothetical protein
LIRFRTLTLPPEVAAAEGYRRLTLDDFRTRGPARMIAELGGAPERLEIREGPKVSVIVRTRDRPQLLAEALASLAPSSYRRAEVVVVNDGGATPELPADFPLELRLLDLEENRGRAGAANAGIADATGDYVTFLDDDDLVEPEHLATLAGVVQAAGVRVAYTDAAVGVYELGDAGWRCVERRLPYSRDFDPGLLLVDNYIPFNTVAIERRLLDRVGELDPELPFFEDWDLLIRLAAHTPFHHLARVTCEYRQLRGAGHHVLGDEPRRRADFLAMKGRVIAHHAEGLTPEVTARLVDALRRETVEAEEEVAAVTTRLREAEERYHRRNGELRSVETHLRVVEDGARRARAEADELRRIERERTVALAERDRELQAAYDEIERLQGLIGAMESTRAWRLHRWLERWKG